MAASSPKRHRTFPNSAYLPRQGFAVQKKKDVLSSARVTKGNQGGQGKTSEPGLFLNLFVVFCWFFVFFFFLL